MSIWKPIAGGDIADEMRVGKRSSTLEMAALLLDGAAEVTHLRAQLAERDDEWGFKMERRANGLDEKIRGLEGLLASARSQLAEAQRNGMGCVGLLKQTADERDEAQADSRRLDWLDMNAQPIINYNDPDETPRRLRWSGLSHPDNLRTAIDAAMQAGEEPDDG